MVVAVAAGQTPKLPATVRSLDLDTGKVTDVAVKWEAMAENIEAGTHTIRGDAQVQVQEKGRGKAMTRVTAVVHVAPHAQN